MHVLDNPAWHALTSTQAHLAEVAKTGSGTARRFAPDVSIFAAMRDDPDPDDWAALQSLIGPGSTTELFRTPLPVPSDWTLRRTHPCHQMIADTLRAREAEQPIEELTDDHRVEMAALVERTDPGPWAPRTHELGTFLGLRIDGHLVAMAGERMRCAGHTEISAVCTAPEFRGHGFAAALTLEITRRIIERGETAFLHVLENNHAAIALYESLGFATRAQLVVPVLRAPV